MSEFSTEPLSVRFGEVALPEAVVTNAEIDDWSAVLVDFYGATATASDNYTCSVSSGTLRMHRACARTAVACTAQQASS
jgi:hypothetical protein